MSIRRRKKTVARQLYYEFYRWKWQHVQINLTELGQSLVLAIENGALDKYEDLEIFVNGKTYTVPAEVLNAR